MLFLWLFMLPELPGRDCGFSGFMLPFQTVKPVSAAYLSEPKEV